MPLSSSSRAPPNSPVACAWRGEARLVSRLTRLSDTYLTLSMSHLGQTAALCMAPRTGGFVVIHVVPHNQPMNRADKLLLGRQFVLRHDLARSGGGTVTRHRWALFAAPSELHSPHSRRATHRLRSASAAWSVVVVCFLSVAFLRAVSPSHTVAPRRHCRTEAATPHWPPPSAAPPPPPAARPPLPSSRATPTVADGVRHSCRPAWPRLWAALGRGG